MCTSKFGLIVSKCVKYCGPYLQVRVNSVDYILALVLIQSKCLSDTEMDPHTAISSGQAIPITLARVSTKTVVIASSLPNSHSYYHCAIPPSFGKCDPTRSIRAKMHTRLVQTWGNTYVISSMGVVGQQ